MKTKMSMRKADFEKIEGRGKLKTLARFIQCKYRVRDNFQDPGELFARHYPNSAHVGLVKRVTKAAVLPSTTHDSSRAGAIAPMRDLFSEFVAVTRPSTVIGRIQGYRRVPFNVRWPR